MALKSGFDQRHRMYMLSVEKNEKVGRTSCRFTGDLQIFFEASTINEDTNLGGGFKHFLFSPLFGEIIQFDKYFSSGLKPPTRNL